MEIGWAVVRKSRRGHSHREDRRRLRIRLQGPRARRQRTPRAVGSTEKLCRHGEEPCRELFFCRPPLGRDFYRHQTKQAAAEAMGKLNAKTTPDAKHHGHQGQSSFQDAVVIRVKRPHSANTEHDAGRAGLLTSCRASVPPLPGEKRVVGREDPHGAERSWQRAIGAIVRGEAGDLLGDPLVPASAILEPSIAGHRGRNGIAASRSEGMAIHAPMTPTPKASKRQQLR